MLSIRTNMPAYLAQRGLRNSSLLLAQAVQRMTTGFKINHSKDDAANYQISTRLDSQLSSLEVAEDNTSMGIDMLSTAEETLSMIGERYDRLKNLAMMAENNTMGGQTLDAINQECQAIVEQIKKMYREAEFNGMKLFGGEISQTVDNSATSPTPADPSDPPQQIYATADTKMQQLGISSTTFQVNNADGSVIESYDVESIDTLQDVFDTLAKYEIEATITDGIISINSDNGRYVSGDLVQQLGIVLDIDEYIEKSDQASDTSVTYETNELANESSTLAELGALTSGTDVIRINNRFGEFMGEFTVSSDTTLGELFNELKTYNIKGTVDDGVITFSSSANNYLVSNGVIANLGVESVEGSNAVTAGLGQTSADEIVYEQVNTLSGGTTTIQQEVTTTIYTTTTSNQTVTTTVWTTNTSSETVTTTVWTTNTSSETVTTTVWTTTTSSTTITETIHTGTTFGVEATSSATVTYTSIDISSTTTATEDMTLASLGMEGNYSIGSVSFNGSTTIAELVSDLNTAGINASFTDGALVIEGQIKESITVIESLRVSNTTAFVAGTTYQVASSEDLIALQHLLDTSSLTFEMTNDINMEGVEFYGIEFFNGTFNGNGYNINNLTINRPEEDQIGLFTETGPACVIENIKLVDCNIIGKAFVGAIVSQFDGGVISNCYVSGTITASGSRVGGLVGYASDCTITSCHTEATVTGDDETGGLVGYASDCTITNCHTSGVINGSQYVGGLVGYAGNCEIESSAAEDVDIEAKVDGIGGLVGYIENTIINNCHATGLIAYYQGLYTINDVGGLVGAINLAATITNSYTSVDIDSGAGSCIGGFIGNLGGNGDTKISNCYSTGSVMGYSDIGGFFGVAVNFFSDIQHCYSTGDIILQGGDEDNLGFDVGGFVGRISGFIYNCYSTGNIEGEYATKVGGFCGSMVSSQITNCYSTGNIDVTYGQYMGGFIGDFGFACHITNCYATGNVNGDSNLGGFTGNDGEDATIESCYALGIVTGNTNVGGFIGRASYNYAECTNNYYNTNNSTGVGSGTFSSVTGKSISQIQSIMTPAVMGFTEANGWHVLGGQPVLNISGQLKVSDVTVFVAGTTYQVSTYQDLLALQNMVSAGVDTTSVTFEMTSNIDMNSIEFNGIGGGADINENGFKGIFNGNGFTINNLSRGLFNYTDGATIESVNININMTDSTDFGAGLIYMADNTTINNCYVSGTILGTRAGGLVAEGCDMTITNSSTSVSIGGADETAGGLVGIIITGSILNCYTEGSVDGGDNVGGLVGNAMNTEIYSCYSSATVDGDNNIGGLVGNMESTIISKSYATGNVTASSHYGGGLVGYGINSGINNSYATGNVTVQTHMAGGLVGYIADYTIENCYATGSIESYDAGGGLIGCVAYNGSITNCYATGNITGIYSGGFISYLTGTLVINKTYALGELASSSCGAFAAMCDISNVSITGSENYYNSNNDDMVIYEMGHYCSAELIGKTPTEIQSIMTPDIMGFTEANGWDLSGTHPTLNITAGTTGLGSSLEIDNDTLNALGLYNSAASQIKSKVFTYSPNINVNITTDTKLSDLGFSTDQFITVQNNLTQTIITLGTDSTIGNMASQLANAGLTATLSEGILSIAESDTSYISGMSNDLKNALKLGDFYEVKTSSEKITTIWTTTTTSDTEIETIWTTTTSSDTVTDTIWTTTTSSDTETQVVLTTSVSTTTQTTTQDIITTLPGITETVDVMATMATTFRQLGAASRRYVTVVNNDTKTVITIKTADTIGDFVTRLNEAGMNTSFADGKLVLTPNSKFVYITGMNEDLANILKLESDFYETSLATKNTDSNLISYITDVNIRQNTMLNQVGVTSGFLLVKRNGEDYATISVSEFDTVNNFLDELRLQGFNVKCLDGKISKIGRAHV